MSGFLFERRDAQAGIENPAVGSGQAGTNGSSALNSVLPGPAEVASTESRQVRSEDSEGEAPRGSQAALAKAGGGGQTHTKYIGWAELYWLDGFPISSPCREWEESCWGSGQVPSSSCEGEGNSSLT